MCRHCMRARQRTPASLHRGLTGQHDAERLTEEEPSGDAGRNTQRQTRVQVQPLQTDTRIGERKQRHDREGGPRVQPRFQPRER